MAARRLNAALTSTILRKPDDDRSSSATQKPGRAASARLARRRPGRAAQAAHLRGLRHVAARVVELKSRIKIHLSSSVPGRAIFRLALGRLPRLII
jgi:hypothetical protein